MTHELPKLEYGYDALEPHIDKETMEIHHTKHHQAYVNKLNAALEGKNDLLSKDVDSLISDIDSIPEDIRGAVRNHGGGHSNHTLFWQIMGPNAGGEATGAIAEAIARDFGGYVWGKIPELSDLFVGAGTTCT